MPDPIELPYQADPSPLFHRLLRLPDPVLLHSADRSNRFGRYDIMAAAPHTPVRYCDGQLTVGGQVQATQQPLAALAAHFNPPAQPARPSQAPFETGFLGYFGYPLHQTLERQQPAPPSPDTLPDDWPDLWGGLYDWSIVTDHRARWTRLYSSSNQARQAGQRAVALPPLKLTTARVGAFKPSLTNAGYQGAFARTQALIASGDCYQVNFARHFEASFAGSPFDLFAQWLPEQPAPFAAYLGLGPQRALVSLSPERFVNLRGTTASVSPIKGTRPRPRRANSGNGRSGRSENGLATDALAKLALLASAKDRAENLMIVDLLRNDLGRIARPGSVRVTHLFEPVSFDNVHHLVSTIEAELQAHHSALDLVSALFPCGSVTGAPKIRAIDIINELEPVGRSAYCGAIGYIDERGGMDLSVTIRSAVIADERLHLWGGGGLVADSSVDAERQEIEDKIGRLLRHAGQARTPS